MAGRDKTYCDNYADYRAFKTWADAQVITFFDGHTECVGDWVWDCEKGYFTGEDVPIMNTPTWLDVYLIKHCTVAFVVDRMMEVYGGFNYNEFKEMDLQQKPPEDFKQNRKINIKPIPGRTSFKIHSKPFGGKVKWWLQCKGFDWWYNDETKTWSHYSQYYPHNTNTAYITSVKGLVRHLRKQYLPSGLTFTLVGRYVGEDYLVTIH